MSLVKIKWEGAMKFVGVDDSGSSVSMDASEIYGGSGQGVRPMELLLMALGGCTGIELAHILRKMRISFNSLIIEIKGERSENHPKVFKTIDVVYRFTGPDLPVNKIYNALKLTDETYCSVSNMLNKSADIFYTLVINGEIYRYPDFNQGVSK